MVAVLVFVRVRDVLVPSVVKQLLAHVGAEIESGDELVNFGADELLAMENGAKS